MSAWHRRFDRHLAVLFSLVAMFFFAATPVNAVKSYVHPRLIIVDNERAASEILSEVRGGKSFALLAKERSIDEKSRDRYGDLGPIELRSLALPLRKAAAELKDGEMSDIIKLDENRYALLQIVDLHYYSVGARAFRAGQYGTAEPNLLKHIEINPDAVKARVMLGKIYESRKETGKAETVYREALFYDPSDEEAYARLGGLYMTTEQYERASALYGEALRHLPDTELFKLGIRAAGAHIHPAGKPATGKVFMRIIVALNGSDAASILSELRQGKDFPYLAKTRSIDEKSKASCGYLGEVEINTLDKPIQEALSRLSPGETSGVIQLSDSRYVIVQKTDVHYLTEGEKAFAAGDFDAAEKDLIRHVQLNPDSVKALAMLGKIYEAKKDFAKAEKLYRQAISYDPSAVLIYERLGRELLLQGQYGKARELYQEGLAHVPSSEVLGEGLEMTDILLIDKGRTAP
jgi:Flp pilus assembly protein TadD